MVIDFCFVFFVEHVTKGLLRLIKKVRVVVLLLAIGVFRVSKSNSLRAFECF